ncbi:mRNA export factor Gle1 [Palaemon carinicauda]|uniref:mRNA export factor Gle1 n=1 Tax=Palaemon carinicauda TaxID=392227 RepID=UPI0035B64F99
MESENPTDLKKVLDALNNSKNLTHWHKAPKDFGPDNPEFSDYNRNDLTDPGDLSLISFTEEFAFGDDSSGEDAGDGNTEEEENEDEEQNLVDDMPPVVGTSLDWMDPAEEIKEKDRHPSLRTAELARHQNSVLMKIQELQLEEDCKKTKDQNVVCCYQRYLLQLKEIKRQQRLQYQQYCKERDENIELEVMRLQKQKEEIRQTLQQNDLEYDQYIEQKSSELNQLIEAAERREVEHRNVIEGLVNDLHTLKAAYIEKYEEMKQLLRDLNSDQSLNITVETMKNEAIKPVDNILELVTREAQTKEELTEVKTNLDTNLNYLDGIVQTLIIKREEQEQQESERVNYEESQAKLRVEQEKQALAMENELYQAKQAVTKVEATEENRQAIIITQGQKRFEELQKKIEDNISSLSEVSNEKKKEIGWIFTTINQLDSINHNNNREKLQKLIAYLSGRNVQNNKKVYCTNNDPLITAYVKFKLIKDIVKVALDTQAKETGGIAAYAWLIVSLMTVYPDLWEIFLYHIYTTCPYLVPLFIYQKEGQSQDDYDKERGKRPKEGFDIYLTRMGNAALLYGLVLAKMCKNSGMPEEAPIVGWKFVAGLLMLDPLPGVSAEILRQFLHGVGSELQQSYGKQFAKLMDYATDSYWIQLEEITNIAKEGESSRNQLQQLFEEYKKTKKLKPNEHINKYN